MVNLEIDSKTYLLCADIEVPGMEKPLVENIPLNKLMEHILNCAKQHMRICIRFYWKQEGTELYESKP